MLHERTARATRVGRRTAAAPTTRTRGARVASTSAASLPGRADGVGPPRSRAGRSYPVNEPSRGGPLERTTHATPHFMDNTGKPRR